MDDDSCDEILPEADKHIQKNAPSDGAEQSTEQPGGGLMYGGMTESEKQTGRFRFWNFEFRELEDSRKDGDSVVLAHYRWVKSFTVSDPEMTSSGKLI